MACTATARGRARPGTDGWRPAGWRRAGPSAHRRQRELDERALGRSRGGLTSKIHLACDGRGRPLAFVLTAGTRNDCTQAETVIGLIRVADGGPGRPRVRPERVIGDRPQVGRL
ncbi:transposase [Streptomyces sp. NPDC058401]|uniref:transposase n=1 Tax=Streptomyces sp. NPDC058401 TaxID=3346480 RepID=UPI00365D5609